MPDFFDFTETNGVQSVTCNTVYGSPVPKARPRFMNFGKYQAVHCTQDHDLVAIEGRRQGLHLRDTILIIGPTTCSFVLLFRKPHETASLNIEACRVPCDEDTSREQVGPKGWSGGWAREQVGPKGWSGRRPTGWGWAREQNLNGGAYSKGGRAQALPNDDRTGKSLGMFEPGRSAGTYKQPSGRWPPNVVFVEREGPRFYPWFRSYGDFWTWLEMLLTPPASTELAL